MKEQEHAMITARARVASSLKTLEAISLEIHAQRSLRKQTVREQHEMEVLDAKLDAARRDRVADAPPAADVDGLTMVGTCCVERWWNMWPNNYFFLPYCRNAKGR
jgi:hypothetical protein